jgi:hypothetical protein
VKCSGLIQFHLDQKEALNLFSIKEITLELKEEKIIILQSTKRITFKFRISAKFLGDICDYFIKKNSMLCFRLRQIILLLSADKTKNIITKEI